MSSTDFKGVTHYGDTFVSNTLEVNFKMWLEWGLLRIGGWAEVGVPTDGAWGGDTSKLRHVNNSGYTNGRVWEARRKDWVWESNVNYIDKDGGTQNPNPVGTPQVNGSPSAVPFAVDYPNGRVIFDTAISPSATMQLAYSYRAVQVYRANETPWFQQLQFGTLRADEISFNKENGTWSIGSFHRVQMPCIILETVARMESTPFELGNGALKKNQDILFHIIAENTNDRNKLMDIITQQNGKGMYLFNVDRVIESGDMPLDENGALVGSLMYPDLVDAYRWTQCYIVRATGSEVESITPNLHEGVVRATIEVVLGGH